MGISGSVDVLGVSFLCVLWVSTARKQQVFVVGL